MRAMVELTEYPPELQEQSLVEEIAVASEHEDDSWVPEHPEQPQQFRAPERVHVRIVYGNDEPDIALEQRSEMQRGAGKHFTDEPPPVLEERQPR
jgi:hypothetical protein